MTYGIWTPGPLILAIDVDEAVLAVMREWLPTYLNQLATARNVKLPAPQVWVNALPNDDEWMDHQLPALIVTTADTSRVTGGANFFYEAFWNVTISAVVRGTNGPATRKRAALYEGAVRECFLNKCRGTITVDGLPDLALANPDWKGAQVAPIRSSDPNDQGRYLAAGIGKYNVATDRAVQSFGGPDVPDAGSYVPLATVTDVVIDVESEE